ncbi:hypothetical protein [Thermostichus sp. MS-CIW-26]
MRIRWQRLASQPSTCYCAACGKRFAGGKRVRHLFNDKGLDLGPLCPACFALPPEQLREQIRRYAYLIRLNRLRDPGIQDHAHHLEQAAQERSIRYPGLWGWLRQWW